MGSVCEDTGKWGEDEGSVIISDVYLCNPRVRRGELRVRACSISTAHYAMFGSPSVSSSGEGHPVCSGLKEDTRGRSVLVNAVYFKSVCLSVCLLT